MHNSSRYSCKTVNNIYFFPHRVAKNTQISNLMKICLVKAELSHADGWTDKRRETSKLTAVLGYSANAPKIRKVKETDYYNKCASGNIAKLEHENSLLRQKVETKQRITTDSNPKRTELSNSFELILSNFILSTILLLFLGR